MKYCGSEVRQYKIKRISQKCFTEITPIVIVSFIIIHSCPHFVAVSLKRYSLYYYSVWCNITERIISEIGIHLTLVMDSQYDSFI